MTMDERAAGGQRLDLETASGAGDDWIGSVVETRNSCGITGPIFEMSR